MTATTRTILQELARQAQQPNRQKVARVRLTHSHHPRYFAPDGAQDKAALHRELTDLEAAGTLRLKWHKYEHGNLLEWVDLQPGQAHALYTAIGHTPTTALEARVQDALNELDTTVPWLAEYHLALQDVLDRHKKPVPWGLDPTDPARMRDVIRTLNAIARLQRTTLTRTFSAQTLGDSKRFDTIQNDVLKALRRVSPHQDTASGDRELLLAHNLQRVPTLTHAYGSIALHASGTVLDLRDWPTPIGLHAKLIDNAQIDSNATALITIENPASFELLTEQAPRDLAIVLTAGFPSTAVLQLLRAFTTRSIPAYHWGDIDIGGFRILAHLRRHAGPFTPLAMGADDLHRHTDDLHPLTQKDEQGRQALLDHPHLRDCQDALHALRDGKIEQEAIPTDIPLARIQAALHPPHH